MFFSFFKKTALQLAKIGGKKFLAALKKFITDSRLINEIHDRADKDLFLAAASSEEYRHIADIKERNIYDKFIELCFNQHLEGINIEQFVETNYSHKTPEAKNYIKCFFYNLSMIIFEVLKSQVYLLFQTEKKQLRRRIKNRYDIFLFRPIRTATQNGLKNACKDLSCSTSV